MARSGGSFKRGHRGWNKGQRTYVTCTKCGKPNIARGLCATHYRQWLWANSDAARSAALASMKRWYANWKAAHPELSTCRPAHVTCERWPSSYVRAVYKLPKSAPVPLIDLCRAHAAAKRELSLNAKKGPTK